jgi:peptidoglycan/xylan/chitin deacetylase (PgdA/CDA1 family)
VRDALKATAGRIVYGVGLHRLLLREASVVVNFHRVNDVTAGDGLTCSIRDLERYCRFFRSAFEVVPLRELVARLEQGRSVGGLLAITLDDGYRDSFENAAPVLSRLGLPATFFVTTGFVGTGTVSWWDRHLAESPGWMSWDQVRTLRSQGFDVGSHTRSHADLAGLTEAEVRAELRGSREDLQRMAGVRPDLFALPYGREENVNDAVRRIVREEGFRCCLSCHGGRVPSGADPFRMARIAHSSWLSSPSQLALEIALGRA